jgi:hypothetical protein
MQPDGSVVKSVSDTVFKEIATTIVSGMYEENINTRSLNSVKSPRYTQLMNELHQIVAESGEPSSSGRATPTAPSDGTSTNQAPSWRAAPPCAGTSPSSGFSGGGTAEATPVAGTSTTTEPPPPRRKRKLKNLDLSQIKVPDSYPEAVKLLLGELSEIDVQKYPNATFLMIRAVLEKSIKSFAEAKSIEIRTTGNNQNGRVQLGHALKWLLEYVKDNGPNYLKQVIEGVASGQLVTYTNSGDSLNALNHNHHFKVDADQAFAMWTSIDSIMRHLMKP